MSSPPTNPANLAPGSTDRAVGNVHRAGFWMLMSRFGGKAIDVLTLFLLARVLGPAEFGLVAVGVSVVQVVEACVDVPIAQGLLRQREVDDEHRNTAFTLGLCRALILTAILGALAVAVKSLQAEPRLVSIILLLTIAPIMRGLASPGLVDYQRALQFGRVAVVEFVGKVGGLIAAALVLVHSSSYWAIVAPTVVAPTISTIASYVTAFHRPRLSLKRWRDFSDIVGWATVSQCLGAVNWQIDRLVLARFASQRILGAYTMAVTVAMLPIQLVAQPLARSTIAAMGRATNSIELQISYLNASRSITFFAVPMLAALAIFCEQLLPTILGDHWSDAAQYARTLSILTLFTLPTQSVHGLLVVIRKTRLVAIRQAMLCLARVPVVVLSIWLWEAQGALAAFGIAALVELLIGVVLVKQCIGLSVVRQLAAVLPHYAAAVGSGFLSFAVSRVFFNPLISSLVGSVVLTILYIASTQFTWRAGGRPDGFESVIARKLALVRVGMHV